MLDKTDSNIQIRKGAVISYLTLLFNIISGLLYTPWMIEQIGQSDYGLYTLAISIISFFALDFGLGSAVARFISDYKAKNDEERIEQFLGIAYKLFAIISALILVALIIVYYNIQNIYAELSALEIQKLKILYVITGFFTVVTLSLIHI